MNRPIRATFIAGALAAAAFAAVGCTTVVNPPTAPASAQPTTFNAQAVTVAGCKALAAWEVSSATGTQAEAATSTQVQMIIHNSAGTQFSSDLDTWVVDLQTGDTADAVTDAGTVNTDCAVVGINNVTGGG
jgi:hypothetical protein